MVGLHHASGGRQVDQDRDRCPSIDEPAGQHPHGRTKTQQPKRTENDGQGRSFLVGTHQFYLKTRLNILVLSFIYVFIYLLYLFYSIYFIFLNTGINWIMYIYISIYVTISYD